MGSRRLEDAIHGVLVRRAAPEWLPFVPGASYWVPPLPRALGVAELLSSAMHITRGAEAMTEEEALSFTTVRGWPSAAYFVAVSSIGDLLSNVLKWLPVIKGTF
nr:unknown [Zea mays]|eukprot:NP_001132770.1 uncharacterized protein LOC100194258 [Zea mays]